MRPASEGPAFRDGAGARTGARLALTALCAVAALAMLAWPMYWDHGVFVLVAQSIRDGHAPYVAAFDVKGPVAFLPYALALSLPVAPGVAVRVADVVVLAAAAWAIERALRPHLGALARRVVTTLLVLGYVASGFIMTAQPDGWCALLLTAAAVYGVCAFGRRPVRAGLTYGVAVGVCVWIKPTFLIFLGPPLAACLGLPPARRPALGRAVLAAGAGAAAVAALVLAWLGAQGALGAVAEVQWGFNRTVYAVAESLGYGRRAGEFVYEVVRGSRYFMFPVLVPGALAFLADREVPRAARWFAVAFVGAGAVNLLVQGKFIPYQWMPVAVPVSVMAGLGYARAAAAAVSAERSPAVRGVALGALAIALASLALEPMREAARGAAVALGVGDRDAYLSTKIYTNEFTALGDAQVARYLGARLAPTEPLALWGLPATVPVLAGRPVVSRFVHTEVLGFGRSPLLDRYRGEYLAAFDRARPRYFIYPVFPAGGAPDTVPAGQIRRQFPELWTRLARSYALDTVIPGFVVMRRTDGLPMARAGLAR